MCNSTNTSEQLATPATELDLLFPKPPSYISEEYAEKTKDAIRKGGYCMQDGKTGLSKDSLAQILNTDKKGVNIFVEKLIGTDELKCINGETVVSTPKVKEELSRRIEQPRSDTERQNLQYNDSAVDSLRDCQEAERRRSRIEDTIRSEIRNLKKKRIKEYSITHDELTKEELQDNSAAHHITRKKDDPDKATDLDNIVIVNDDTHTTIHKECAETPEKLDELCDKKGWNRPNKSSKAHANG